jgi:hypothetical protein
MPETSMITASMVRSTVSKSRRRQILTALLGRPAGLTFAELLEELPRPMPQNEEIVRRELRRLEVDGHVVVSFEGRWLTSRPCIARFNRGRS